MECSRMKETTLYIAQQNENRRLWSENDTPENVAAYITEEAQELEEAIQEAMITGDVFSVASELGDLFYLVEKLGQMLGIDPEQAAHIKVIRNSLKYPDHIMSNGLSYPEAVRTSKEVWSSFGGDSAFSHVYLDYLAHE